MKAEYIDHMGDDLTVVNAARVSFDKESEYELVIDLLYSKLGLKEKDKRLISYLARHNHFTPFTHCVVTLRETVPIFVARQRFKHMVGFTYNEVSRRYVDDEPEFYFPDVWRKRAEDKKQGSADEAVTEPLRYRLAGTKTVSQAYKFFVNYAEDFYRELIEHGVAPEQARMVLPQSMYTSYYVTGSLAAFARAYKLRIDPHAQVEIQELAKKWDEVIRPLFPVSWKALVDG